MFNCARLDDDTLWCWGDDKGGVGNATYYQAGPFSSRPENPVTGVTAMTSRGTTGFPTSMRYLTSDGSYYQGPLKVTPACP